MANGIASLFQYIVLLTPIVAVGMIFFNLGSKCETFCQKISSNNHGNISRHPISSNNHGNISRHPKSWDQFWSSDQRPREALPSPGCFHAFQQLGVLGLSFHCAGALVVGHNMSRKNARDSYYRHLLRTHAKCAHKELLGKLKDGGWWSCKVKPFIFKKNCLVYSFGIRDDWSFDDAASKQYGCEVHSFDPSIHQEDHKHSELVYFHNTGLGGVNEVNSKNWKMRTFCTLLKELGHENRTVDYLKFDIEFSEWDAMAAMLREGCLSQVKQIGLEVHSWGDSTERYLQFWQDLQGLENLGFQKWRLFNRYHRCFHPNDDKNTQRCPQTDMNFFNINYVLDYVNNRHEESFK